MALNFCGAARLKPAKLGRVGYSFSGSLGKNSKITKSPWGWYFFMLKRIHHAAIICSDYAVSKRFYTECLGLRVLAEHYRAERDSFKLDLALPDGGQIELFSFPAPPARPSFPEACGLRHLAFAVEDLAVCVHRLTEQGVAVQDIRVDEFTGQRFVFFTDPDGLPLELYECRSA